MQLGASQLKDKFEDGDKEKIKNDVQDALDRLDKNEKRRSTATRMMRRGRGRSRPKKSSRINSHEDKVETEDIKWKYKVVNYVEKKTRSGTQTALRRLNSGIRQLRPHCTWMMANTPRI